MDRETLARGYGAPQLHTTMHGRLLLSGDKVGVCDLIVQIPGSPKYFLIAADRRQQGIQGGDYRFEGRISYCLNLEVLI
jgi:hypothetical protein